MRATSQSCVVGLCESAEKKMTLTEAKGKANNTCKFHEIQTEGNLKVLLNDYGLRWLVWCADIVQVRLIVNYYNATFVKFQARCLVNLPLLFLTLLLARKCFMRRDHCVWADNENMTGLFLEIEYQTTLVFLEIACDKGQILIIQTTLSKNKNTSFRSFNASDLLISSNPVKWFYVGTGHLFIKNIMKSMECMIDVEVFATEGATSTNDVSSLLNACGLIFLQCIWNVILYLKCGHA